MNILHNHDLTQSTGFKTPLHVRKYILIEHEKDIETIPAFGNDIPLIIGGGTNYLFVKTEIDSAISYTGSEITVIEDSNLTSLIRVGAGKVWHEFIIEMLDNGLFGLENLVLIPGTVGAAPVQNIGAYGKEVAESIQTVHGIQLSSGMRVSLSNEQCEFTYRHSIFKTKDWNDFLITHVDFLLQKIEYPMAHYPDVQAYFTQQEIHEPHCLDIAHAIMDIRQRKLPDPSIIGNAGSFFKNPIIDISTYQTLKSTYPDMPSYPVDDKTVKIPAGWLIDKAGWKGFRHNGAGVHEHQALVLINANDAFGADIYALSHMVQNSILNMYGITLEPEVNIIA